MRRIQRLANRQILTGLLLAMGTCVYAQTTDQTPPQEPTSQDAASSQEEAPPKPAIAAPILDVGCTAWKVSGNRHKYLQYATPPKGLDLRSLSYDPYSLDYRGMASFLVETPDQPDFLARGMARLNYGRTSVALFDRRNKFFDPTPTVVPRSQREIGGVYARQFLTHDLSVAVRGQKDQQDAFFEAPAQSLRQRTYTWTGTASGQVAGGFGGQAAALGDFREFAAG